jgi:hypothetical protein
MQTVAELALQKAERGVFTRKPGTAGCTAFRETTRIAIA